MKQRFYLQTFLALAGLTGFSVGAGQLFFPITFEASSGIDLGTDINLLSEIRAAGGSLVLFGILIVTGVFKRGFTKHALFLTTVLYLSYGFSRLFGFLADGTPNQLFVIVTIVEIAIGSVAFLVYWLIKREVN